MQEVQPASAWVTVPNIRMTRAADDTALARIIRLVEQAREARAPTQSWIEEVEGGRRLRFDSSTYQTASMTGEDAGVSVTPFGLWIIDRAGGPVVVEENVQNLIGGEPVWRERARLEAGS